MLLRKIVIDGTEIDLVNDEYIKNERSYFSIIVGPNGSGKSRILEAISATGIIRQYLEFKGHKSTDGRKDLKIEHQPIGFLADVSFKESFLLYENKDSNNLAVKRFNPNNPGVRYGFFNCESSGYEVPSKIICVTNGVFNKFPSVTNSPTRDIGYDYSSYQNLSISEDILEGGKDLIHGAMSKIFSKLILNSFFSGEKIFNKLIAFLSAFGISGGYKLHLRANSMLKGVSSKGVYDESEVRERYKNVIKPLSQGKSELTDDIIGILDDVFKKLFTSIELDDYEMSDTTYFFPDRYLFQINVNDEHDSENELYQRIKLVAEYGFIYVEKIEFTKNGHDISLDSMSSGEINLFLLLLKINSVIEDNSIVLIDEPELSLHPSWQNEIVPSLQRAFSLYSGCHFIISTHSPHVVASVPENDSCVIILNNFPRAFPGHRFSGKSSDFQLFSVLGFVGAENDYLITQLILIISKLAEEVPLSQGEQYLLEEAGNILKNENTSSRVKHLILQAQRLNGSRLS